MNLVPARTVDDAKRQLTRIRLTAGIVRENMPRLQALIMEAKSFGDYHLGQERYAGGSDPGTEITVTDASPAGRPPL